MIAANRDGVWNEQGDVCASVLPPFYGTGWFLALTAMGVTGLAVFPFDLASLNATGASRRRRSRAS